MYYMVSKIELKLRKTKAPLYIALLHGFITIIGVKSCKFLGSLNKR